MPSASSTGGWTAATAKQGFRGERGLRFPGFPRHPCFVGAICQDGLRRLLMGTIAEGTVIVGGQRVNCKADFASDHVTFSGGRRGEVPYSKIQVVATAKGLLKLRV